MRFVTPKEHASTIEFSVTGGMVRCACKKNATFNRLGLSGDFEVTCDNVDSKLSAV